MSADSQALANGDYAPTNTASKQGIYALDKADLFNLFCIPPDLRNGTTDPSVYQAAMTYCVGRRAMLIVDSPAAWSANAAGAAAAARSGLSALGLTGTDARNAALYFPRVKEADPLRSGQVDTFVPSGIVAGVFARTDVTRGVWKAPAGLDATLNGVVREDGRPFTWCYWGQDIESLLPHAELVTLEGGPEDARWHFHVPFGDVTAIMGWTDEEGYSPSRVRPRAWPDRDQLAQLRAHEVRFEDLA